MAPLEVFDWAGSLWYIRFLQMLLQKRCIVSISCRGRRDSIIAVVEEKNELARVCVCVFVCCTVSSVITDLCNFKTLGTGKGLTVCNTTGVACCHTATDQHFDPDDKRFNYFLRHKYLDRCCYGWDDH